MPGKVTVTVVYVPTRSAAWAIDCKKPTIPYEVRQPVLDEVVSTLTELFGGCTIGEHPIYGAWKDATGIVKERVTLVWAVGELDPQKREAVFGLALHIKRVLKQDSVLVEFLELPGEVIFV